MITLKVYLQKFCSLGGSESPLFLKHGLDALDKVLPCSNRVELQDFDQDSAQNYGKPELIAEEIKRFLQ